MQEQHRFLSMIVQNTCMIDRRLRVLHLLASTGTVTATATALHYTPSAVSAQLRSLADDLGVSLLEPDGRRLQLTSAGRALAGRLNDLFELAEQIQADVLNAAGDVAGDLRVCGFSTAAATLLPAVVTTLTAAHPQVTVQVIEANPRDCFDMLASRQVDIAVVISTLNSPPRSDPRFEQQTLLRDPLDLLVPSGHPLAGRTSAELELAAGERWIADRDGSPYHQLLLTACATAGFVPDIAHRVVEWDAGSALVAAGLGCSLVPRLARLPAGHDVVRVPLHGNPRPDRNILTAIRRGSRNSPLIAEALSVLTAAAARLSQSID